MENNFGRKHTAPKEYTYFLKSISTYGDTFISLLMQHTTDYTSIGNKSSPDGIPIFADGI